MAGLGRGDYKFYNSTNSNKTYFFVKLTESAQKSLQEHLKNQKCAQPTITFFGQEGEISIPRENHDMDTFKFQMQRAQDTGGPQGIFECIRQNSSNSMESLGPLLSILRIQAKDDSYETTRQSMANAIAQNEKTCVKELKHKGVMGRQKTRPSIVVPPQKKEASSFTSNHFLSHNGNPPSSSPRNSSGGNSQGKPGWSQSRPIPPPPINGKKNIPSNPGLLRRPIRERIIQTLALKSMKKLELINKLSIEGGIKECDRRNIIQILHSLATVKENAFHLRKNFWSEVVEDWPFYTEEEKALLKRNKPQNASPPGRDSILSHSPKSIAQPSSSSSIGSSQESMKRTPNESGFNPNVKKARFSNPGKLPDSSSLSERCSVSSSDQGWTGGGGVESNGASDNSESVAASEGGFATRHKRLQNHPYENTLHPDNHKALDRRAADAYPQDQHSNNSLSLMNSHCVPPGASISPLSQGNSPQEGPGGSHRVPDSSSGVGSKFLPGSSDKRKNGFNHSRQEPRESSHMHMQEDTDVSRVGRSTPSSPDNGQDHDLNLEQYPKIENVEQRRMYKRKFNPIYEEYQALHTECLETKMRLSELETQWKQLRFGTPESKREIDNIVKELNTCKEKFWAKKKRYNELDRVVHHIKMKVTEFDEANQI